MNNNRFAESVATAVGIILLLAATGSARAQNAKPVAVPAPNEALPGAQPRSSHSLADDFSGLNYTDEQKAQIDKIHRDEQSQKEAVAKDAKLTADQKDAFIEGYTRLEYGQIFRMLTPEQRRQARQKMLAQRTSNLVVPGKQALQK
jgi:Spy/CpxP family protein refolding chaperone